MYVVYALQNWIHPLPTLGLGNFSHMHLKLEDTYLKYKLHTSIIHKSVGGKKHTLHASATYVFIRFE